MCADRADSADSDRGEPGGPLREPAAGAEEGVRVPQEGHDEVHAAFRKKKKSFRIF